MPTEAATIFSGPTDPARVAEHLRRLEPEVRFDGDERTWRQAVISKSKFLRRKTLTINHDKDYYGEPNFSRQKDGMRGFISRFPNIHRNPKAFELINGIQFALGVMFDPESDEGDARLRLVRQLAAAIDGVVFMGAEFQDAEGRALISPHGPPHEEASWPKFCAPNVAHAPDPERLRQFLERMSPEGRERKLRSEALLKQSRVGINSFLGAVVDESQMRRRSAEEIVRRLLCVLAAAMHGEGVGQEAVQGFIGDKGIASSLTPEEAAFISDAGPSQEARMRFGWRYECAWVFLWALGYIDELAPPTQICLVREMGDVVRERSVDELVRDSRPRAAAEILDQADLSLRYHWAEVEARIRGGALPPEFDPGVIVERHYAFNWLINQDAEDWDAVETNT